MLKTKWFWLVVVTIGFVGCSYIGEKNAEDLKTIDTSQLAQGIQDKTLHVFDNNTPEVFSKNHIPTAVHMNPREPDLNLFPQDKQSKLVFYCKNTWCMASHKGAQVALEQGYPNSYVYAEGIDGWIEAGQPIESVTE